MPPTDDEPIRTTWSPGSGLPDPGVRRSDVPARLRQQQRFPKL